MYYFVICCYPFTASALCFLLVLIQRLLCYLLWAFQPAVTTISLTHIRVSSLLLALVSLWCLSSVVPFVRFYLLSLHGERKWHVYSHDGLDQRYWTREGLVVHTTDGGWANILATLEGLIDFSVWRIYRHLHFTFIPDISRSQLLHHFYFCLRFLNLFRHFSSASVSVLYHSEG